MPTPRVLKMRGGCVERATQGTSTVMYWPECRIEILLPPFPCHRLRGNVMNAPSCHRHKCSHRLLQHIGHRLTQMCFDDGSSFFPLISLFFFFFLSSICQGPLDKQVKNIIQSQSCLERDKIEWSKQGKGMNSSAGGFVILSPLKDSQRVKIYQGT